MKTALIFGSSGLIGEQLLKILIQSTDYNKINYHELSNYNIVYMLSFLNGYAFIQRYVYTKRIPGLDHSA